MSSDEHVSAQGLLDAIEMDDMTTVKRAIEQKIDLHTFPEHRESFLFCAVQCNNERIIRELVSNGAKVDDCGNTLPSKCGFTPLIMTVGWGTPEMVHVLLEVGANVLHCDNRGQNVMHFVDTLEKRKLDMFRVLIAHGGRINMRRPDKKNKLPLDIRNCGSDPVWKEIIKEKRILNERWTTRVQESTVVLLPPLVDIVVEFLWP